MERLIEINKELKMCGYIDVSHMHGLLGERARILMLNRELSTDFSFGLK